MRRRPAWFSAVVTAGLGLALAVATPSKAQDFDPRGRHRPRPVGGTQSSGPLPGPATPSSNDGADAVGGSATGPKGAALVSRYTRVVLSQPGAPFPLQRLAQLYRERDGSLANLVTEFEDRVKKGGPDQYGAAVALAGLYKLDGRAEQAVTSYEQAIALRADDPSAALALARLLEERGDGPGARRRFEQALAHQTARTDKEQTLRSMMTLALDASDWGAAKGYHSRLLLLEPTSLFVRGELARELSARGEYARAEGELKDVVAAAVGDNRALAPALKELGRAQAGAHEPREALATLERALNVAAGGAALRAEIYEIIAGIYRETQELPVLVKQLEAEHPTDAARLSLLGGLYEETGDSQRAAATYRRALAGDPKQIDLRLRLIRLLQSNGELDKAISEYESLVRAVPGNPQFVFEECEALLQRGDHARAQKLVADLEARAGNDEEVLSRVADFYARIGDNERSLKVLQRLAAGGKGGDAGHLVDLGDRYFQDGNTALAVQTWKRIATAVTPRPAALVALGDVYLEHDMASDAVAAYREAANLEPGNLSYKKSLAAAYEHTRAYREARELYEEIVKRAKTGGDKLLARECRTRIVTLWGLERTLEQKLPVLRARFDETPPDVDSGRMLGEALVHLRRLPEADAVFRRVIERAPGDPDTYLALERVLVQENRIDDAIAVLEGLARLEPKRARELYQRMAQYALQIYKDDDAIRYSLRAVELSPDDAEGHRRLAEMYRSRQDTDRAIAEFRAAIAKNDRLFIVYFELADLLLSRGHTEDADRMFRAVVRGAPDEELVARAARLSMQINLGRGTLESLEHDLLPLAIGKAERPLYRRLLVEIYGSLTFGLVQRVRHGTEREADEARATLARIGARAVKPLLDALADPDVSQQRIAIDVLAYVENRNAALPLFAFATGGGDLALRTRAMLACGTLADASLVPKYEALLFPKDGGADLPDVGDAIGVAATWGLAHMGRPAALPLLRRVASGSAPTMRALAVLGLGLARDPAAVTIVADLAASVDSGTVARAAAAYALGELNATAHASTLLELAEDGEPLPRRMALLSLARMAGLAVKQPPWQGEAVQAMSDSVFASGGDDARARQSFEAVSRAAVLALAVVATRGQALSGWARSAQAIPMPEAALDGAALLDLLIPGDPNDAERGAALVAYAPVLERAALSALRTSGDRARAVLTALGTGQGEFLPFAPRGASGPEAESARQVATALLPSVLLLAQHPDPSVRIAALMIASHSSSDAAEGAIASALEDRDPAVQRVALGAVGRAAIASPTASAAVASILADEGHPARAGSEVASGGERWPMRVLAAEALGRLGARGTQGVSAPLAAAAAHDAYALVREAALVALSSFDPASARSVAARLLATDPEPRVREAAKALTR